LVDRPCMAVWQNSNIIVDDVITGLFDKEQNKTE
jgi:hypothetical protein